MFIIFFKIFFSTILLLVSGKLLNYFLKIDIENHSFTILKGVILNGFIALFLNFFLPLSLIVNSITSLILISLYLIFLKKNEIKEILKKVIFISIISLILVIYSNAFEPDASLYHLPATYNLNNEKIIVGLNNIHFRFGIVSILQYVNAFNVNFINGNNGIIFISAIIVSTFLVFLIDEFFKAIKSENNLLIFFTIILISIICFRFNRYSDFGNDALGHIYFFLLIFIFIKNTSLKNLELEKNLNIFIIFLCLHKIFYLYLIIIPLTYFFIKFQKNVSFQLNFSQIFSISFMTLWIIKNIFVSGCALYPISISCSNKLMWYNENLRTEPNAKIVSLKGEAWAKNWNKNKTKLNMENYISNLNWLDTWKSDHLKVIIKKLLPFLIFLLLIFFIKLIIFEKKIFLANKKYFLNKNYYLSIIVCLFGLILWFFKFPIFRYGSSFILTLIALITIPFIFSNKFKKKHLTILLLFSLSLFFLKNAQRIYNDFDSKPLLHKIKSDQFKKVKINNIDFYSHDFGCGYAKKLCTNYSKVLKEIHAIKKRQYIVIIPK